MNTTVAPQSQEGSSQEFLRNPSFRGKLISECLVRPEITLHVIKRLTGRLDDQDLPAGTRHTYTPMDVRQLKMAKYGITDTKSVIARPPVINTRMAKGGTGKTMVAANLATALSYMGYRVLAIDCDPQGSLTNMLGVDAMNESVKHLGHLMKRWAETRGEIDFTDAIRPIFPGNMLDLIPADINLTEIDGWLIGQMQRETVVERMFEANKNFLSRYDVIITDSAPGTTLLSLNIMVATRTQLAVVMLDRESLKALPILYGNVQEINDAFPAYRSDIEIVANGYNGTFNHSKEVLSLLMAGYQNCINENVIAQSTAFHRQQSLPGQVSKGPIVEQEPNSPAAKTMFDLAWSLLGRYRIKLADYEEFIPSARAFNSTASEVTQ